MRLHGCGEPFVSLQSSLASPPAENVKPAEPGDVLLQFMIGAQNLLYLAAPHRSLPSPMSQEEETTPPPTQPDVQRPNYILVAFLVKKPANKRQATSVREN